MCREVWDDVTRTAEPSVHHQLSQCTVAVTSTPDYLRHSSQSQLSGTPLKHAAVRQPSNEVFASLPSSLPSSVNSTGGLLVQFQQLVESCGLPDQAASGLMNWFAQELHGISCTLGLFSQQESRPADSVPVHVSLASDGAAGTSEVHASEMYCTQNNACEMLAGSVVSAQMPCSQDALCFSTTAASVERASTQYHTGEMQPPSVATSVDQLSSLAHLQQLQQMYLESAASALHNLCILQQQLVSAVTTTADNTPSTSSTAAVAPTLDAVHSQSADNIPHSK